VALSDTSTGCPVCGFAQRVRVGEWNQLTIVGCPQCGQRYVWPVPSEAVLNAIYDQNYYGGGRGSLGFSDRVGPGGEGHKPVDTQHRALHAHTGRAAGKGEHAGAGAI